ncbi:MAG: hypothetical protein LKI24_00900 [Acidipropionibacterium sp.]|jgi:hypothetical protein|nr:hypothetical protein [Acidipropionibacterium sp.]
MASVLFATITRGLTLLMTPDGDPAEIAPLWVATLSTLPLLLMFASSSGRASSRCPLTHRCTLLGIALIVSGITCAVAFPTDSIDSGFAAAWRDDAALLGLGLLSLSVLPSFAIWAAPLVASLASMGFSWPLHPAVHHGLWGALRAPAGLTFGQHVPNLSTPVCLLIAAAGATAFATSAPRHAPLSAPRDASSSTRRLI